MKITLIRGDGIGPEIMDIASEIISIVSPDIEWEVMLGGENALKEKGELLPEETLESIRRNGIAFKGPITTPVGGGFRSINVALRQELGLFANIRPVRSFEGVDSLYKDIDIIIVRENTEDLYKGIEYMSCDGVAQSIKVITESATKRIAEAAFRLCRSEGRKKVTVAHKANIMKLTDGLFLKAAMNIGEKYPETVTDNVIIDALCMKLVMKPSDFDVILAPNLYGDILSDLAAGLVGGIGLAPSANIGENAAIFEPVHGSAPDIAGKNKANPSAAILSGCMMLRHIGRIAEADRIEKALTDVLKDRDLHTEDAGGTLSSIQFRDEIIKRLQES